MSPGVGHLVKVASNDAVYVVIDGHRRHIPEFFTFEYLGYRPADITVVSDAQLQSLPDLDPLPSFVGREERLRKTSVRDPDGALPTFNVRAITRKQILIVAVCVLVAIALILLIPNIWPFRSGLTVDARETATASLRTALVQTFAGLAVIGGSILTVLSLSVARQTLALNATGQIADRYAKAVELINSAQPTVRLGGLLALTEISRSSVRDRESLSAYFTYLAKDPARSFDELRATLYALSDLRSLGFERAFDLKNLAITSCDIADLRLPDSDLRAADLSGSGLLYLDISGSLLIDVSTHESDVRHSVCRYALFRSCDMRGTNLNDSDLTGAVFLLDDMRGTSLFKADLTDAVFIGCDLRRARFQGADASSATFIDCRLDEAASDAATRWPAGFDASQAGVLLLA